MKALMSDEEQRAEEEEEEELEKRKAEQEKRSREAQEKRKAAREKRNHVRELFLDGLVNVYPDFPWSSRGDATAWFESQFQWCDEYKGDAHAAAGDMLARFAEIPVCGPDVEHKAANLSERNKGSKKDLETAPPEAKKPKHSKDGGAGGSKGASSSTAPPPVLGFPLPPTRCALCARRVSARVRGNVIGRPGRAYREAAVCVRRGCPCWRNRRARLLHVVGPVVGNVVGHVVGWLHPVFEY